MDKIKHVIYNKKKKVERGREIMLGILICGAMIDEQYHLLLSDMVIGPKNATVEELEMLEQLDCFEKRNNGMYYYKKTETWLPYFEYGLELAKIVNIFYVILNNQGIKPDVVIGIFKNNIERSLQTQYQFYTDRILSSLHYMCESEHFMGTEIQTDSGFRPIDYDDCFSVENMDMLVHSELEKQRQREEKYIDITNIRYYTYGEYKFLIAYKIIQFRIVVNEEALPIFREVQAREGMKITQDKEKCIITIESTNKVLDMLYVLSKFTELENIGYEFREPDNEICKQLYAMYRSKTFVELDLQLGFGKHVYVPCGKLLGDIKLESIIVSDEQFDVQNINGAKVWKATYSYTGSIKVDDYNSVFELVQKYCSNVKLKLYSDRKIFEVRMMDGDKFSSYETSVLRLNGIPEQWYNKIILSDIEVESYGCS